jgi:hypothetical protein
MRPLLLILLLMAPTLAAAPLRLILQPLPQQLQFSYRFEYIGQPLQLNFTLDRTRLNNHFRSFRALKPALLQQYLWRDLRAHIASYPGVRLLRLPGKETMRYTLQVADPVLLHQLDTELQQLTDERTAFYLQQQYYTAIDLPWSGQVVIPDHQRLFQDSLPDMLPIATAWHQQLANTPVRESLAILSSWIQQIPYQDLSDRNNSSGASFNPPLKLLQENQGDCDSKVVLLATMLRMLLPDISLAIIYLPEHAMLAAQLPPTEADITVNIDGKDYILVDPTGPALYEPGQINLQYQIYTSNGMFGYALL